MKMPRTSVHMLLTLTSLATILKLLGVPYKNVLIAITPALFVILVIDLGHTSSGRSIITHSILTAPLIGLLVYLSTGLLIGFLNPFIKSLGLDTKSLENLILYGCLYTSILHLLLDSLTYQGIHIPGLGWVSMADLESQGVLANIIPVAISIALVYFFWAGGGAWTHI